MSVQISGAEEGDNITRGGEITFTCSVESVPGLTSVDWFRGEEHLETRDLVTSEEQRLVTSLTLDTSSLELGEAVILCRPDLVSAGFNNNDMAASVRINLVKEAMEYDSSEVEYYDDEEQDEEYYDEYESSEEEEDSYESVEEIPEIVTSNPTNSQELFDTEETTTPTSFLEVSDTTTLSSSLEQPNEYNYEDEEDAVNENLQPTNLSNDQSENEYRDYNYDGASATDYYEGASYQNYAFGNNEIDREEITLTEENSEDFKIKVRAGDATEGKDEADTEPDAATNSFTSREKVLAQTKQREENGNNVATFSQKTLRSGGSKVGSYFSLSQAFILLLMFKLV